MLITNNLAEQALRHWVISWKINYGTLLASGTPEEILANKDVRTAYLGN